MTCYTVYYCVELDEKLHYSLTLLQQLESPNSHTEIFSCNSAQSLTNSNDIPPVYFAENMPV